MFYDWLTSSVVGRAIYPTLPPVAENQLYPPVDDGSQSNSTAVVLDCTVGSIVTNGGSRIRAPSKGGALALWSIASVSSHKTAWEMCCPQKLLAPIPRLNEEGILFGCTSV